MPCPPAGATSQGPRPAHRRHAVPTREHQSGGTPIHAAPTRPVPTTGRAPPRPAPPASRQDRRRQRRSSSLRCGRSTLTPPHLPSRSPASRPRQPKHSPHKLNQDHAESISYTSSADVAVVRGPECAAGHGETSESPPQRLRPAPADKPWVRSAPGVSETGRVRCWAPTPTKLRYGRASRAEPGLIQRDPARSRPHRRPALATDPLCGSRRQRLLGSKSPDECDQGDATDVQQ